MPGPAPVMEIGERTVISIFEFKAVHQPDDIWILRPRDDSDLKAGFAGITYREGMFAVNHAAHWLQSALPPTDKAFPTFAYQGPSDLRVLLLCLAAAKLGKQILLPSRRANAAAQRHLVKTTGCLAFIHGEETNPMFDLAELDIEPIVAPELADWLPGPGLAGTLSAPYQKPWAEAQDDPWILLHTSGTTGLPKVVTYTHKMMAKFDAVSHVDEGPTPSLLFGHGAWFTTIPLSHFVGLVIALQYAPILGCTCIAPPVIKGPQILSTEQIINLIDQVGPFGMVLPPADIERLVTSASGWAALKKVKCINFVGAQLRKSTGDKLVESGKILIYGLGTTEAGGYPQLMRSDKEWDWITFPESAGMTFERYPGPDEVYELVYYKQYELARFQQVFLAFPELDVFPTRDLYHKHPTLRNTWQIAGRSDDYFKLISGYGIFAKPLEDELLENAQHLVSAVLIAGEGHERPCLLLAPKTESRSETLVDSIWPVIEKINRSSHESGHIIKELVLVEDPARPFKLNGKGAVSRRDTLKEYEMDIDELYKRKHE